MKERSYRANATDINKAPREIRYVWIIRYKNGSISTNMSYTSLSRTRWDEVDRLLVCDMKIDELIELNLNYIDKIMEEWRENYFNTDWNLTDYLNSFQ